MRHAEIVCFVYIGRLCLPWHFIGTLRRNQHQMSTLVQPRFRCCHPPSRSVLPIGSPLTGSRVELETQSDSSCNVWSLCHLTSRQFKASIAGVVCMFHTMFHYFWKIYFFDMNAFDRTARDDRQGSSWVVWVRPALAQPDRYSTVWASCGRHRSPSLPDVPWSIAYHALWLDRTNSSIPKKETEKGDRRRATTVHSLAFPILSHPYVILMSWPCGRLSMTQLSYHVYHAFPEVFLTLV